jgi:hypothetical protein
VTHNSDATRKIISEKAKQRWKDPEYRKKMLPIVNTNRKSTKGRKQTEETIKLMSEAKKKTWADPDYRKRMTDLYADPEWKKNKSKSSRVALNKPETKLRMSESGKKAAAVPERREQLLRSLRDPETLKRKREANAKPEFGKNISEKQKELWANPEYRDNHKTASDKRWSDPEERKKASEKAIARFQNPEERRKAKERAIKRGADPVHRSRLSKAFKELHADPEYHRRLCESRADPEYREMQRRVQAKPEVLLKKVEGTIGGFWYGNVRYPERRIYCEKWNKDFRERCRAFDGYKSVLSGIKEEDHIVNGKQQKLSVHHVYYQPKACCEWDEDKAGYYVMLNIGTKRKPNILRYDIKGDPNKFVTLTAAENSMVNHNKLKWIKIFEDIIESNGGKCFFTKEEMYGFVNHKEEK